MKRTLMIVSRNKYYFLSVLLILLFGWVSVVAAAPLSQEAESIIWPVVERMIVVAGAALLLNVWQKWRDRRQGNDGDGMKE